MPQTGTIFDQLASSPAPSQAAGAPSSGGTGAGASGPRAGATGSPAAGGTIFDQLAANPALGDTPAPRPPGGYGPYDESESHLFLGPLDKGVNEGISKSLGLSSPSEGLGDALAETWGHLVDSAKETFQKIADYKQAPGMKTSFDTAGILSGRVPAALLATVPVMTAQGVGGMADALEQGTREIRASFGQGGQVDHQRFGRGVGMLLGSLAQVAMGMEGPESAESAAAKGGETLERRAPRPGNAILRATSERNYLYGKNPGRAFIDEPIHLTNSIENLRGQLEDAGNRLDAQVDQHLQTPAIAGKNIDVPAALDPVFDQALRDVAGQKGLRNRAGIVGAIKTLQDDVLNEHDPAGNATGPLSNKLAPDEVNDLKRSVGKSAKWDTLPGSVDPEIQSVVNDLRKRVYGTLNDLVEQAAPGTKALNARYANVIEATRLLAKRMATEESADLGMRRFLSRAEWLGAIAAYMHGEPVTGTALLGNQVARSTVGRLARSQAMDAAGRAMQTGTGRAVARTAGRVAGTAPAASGVKGRQDISDMAREVLSPQSQ